MKWIINELSELKEVASSFLEYVGDRKVFALEGGMGVGKTTFVKAVGEVLGVQDEVSSPTFAIVNEYQTDAGEVFYHFDCYRINDISEALDFGCEEYFYSGRRCFIEWPDKIGQLLPEDTLFCYFEELEDGRREISIR